MKRLLGCVAAAIFVAMGIVAYLGVLAALIGGAAGMLLVILLWSGILV